VGYEAAQLGEALEGLSPDQRTQALQGALARYFGGADLESLSLELRREVGAPLAVRYRFQVPAFARREGPTLVLPAITFPLSLGRRFVQLGSRRTALFIDATEQSHAKVRLRLPKGHRVRRPLGEQTLESRYGRFVRREAQAGEVLTVEEVYRLDMARIAPTDYADFGQFAGAVDLLQARDLVVEKGEGPR
jgi:cellulose synthase operon protein C